MEVAPAAPTAFQKTITLLARNMRWGKSVTIAMRNHFCCDVWRCRQFSSRPWEIEAQA